MNPYGFMFKKTDCKRAKDEPIWFIFSNLSVLVGLALNRLENNIADEFGYKDFTPRLCNHIVMII